MKQANDSHPVFHIMIHSAGQFGAVLEFLRGKSGNAAGRIYLNADLIYENREYYEDALKKLHGEWTGEICLAFPRIIRKEDEEYLNKIREILQDFDEISGVLTGSLEGFAFMEQMLPGKKIYSDFSFYLWNTAAVKLYEGRLSGGCLPLELKAGEQHALVQATGAFAWEKLIYGRIPMMVTANCVVRTAQSCRKAKARRQTESDFVYLKDRLGKEMPVDVNCIHCMNTIYNSVPLSLHKEIDKWKKEAALRINFTTEDAGMTKNILVFFAEKAGAGELPDGFEYTTAYEKKGVE